MMRAFPRRRQLTHYTPPAIDAAAAGRRFTRSNLVAMLAIAGLAFGVGLCWLADQLSGSGVVALMFAL